MANMRDATLAGSQSFKEGFVASVSVNEEPEFLRETEENFESAIPATGREETLRQISSAALAAIRIFSGRVGYLEARVSELEVYRIAFTERLSQIEQRLAVMEKAFVKEIVDDKEILEEIAMLGEVKREEKQQDPFKLAKGLLDMSKKDYEALLQEE